MLLETKKKLTQYGRAVKRFTSSNLEEERLGESSIGGDGFFEQLFNQSIASVISVSAKDFSSYENYPFIVPSSIISPNSEFSELILLVSASNCFISCSNESNMSNLRSTFSSNDSNENRSSEESFETTMMNGMNELIRRMSMHEKHLAKIDQRIVGLREDLINARKMSKVTKINVLEQEELRKFGIPVDSKDGLDELEESLKNSDYSNHIVSEKRQLLYMSTLWISVNFETPENMFFFCYRKLLWEELVAVAVRPKL